MNGGRGAKQKSSSFLTFQKRVFLSVDLAKLEGLSVAKSPGAQSLCKTRVVRVSSKEEIGERREDLTSAE